LASIFYWDGIPRPILKSLRPTKNQFQSLKTMIQEFSETGKTVKAKEFPVNSESRFRVFVCPRSEQVSISTKSEVPQWEFDEKAGYNLRIEDSQGRCFSVVFGVEQAKKSNSF
jgi:hypothetical protein